MVKSQATHKNCHVALAAASDGEGGTRVHGLGALGDHLGGVGHALVADLREEGWGWERVWGQRGFALAYRGDNIHAAQSSGRGGAAVLHLRGQGSVRWCYFGPRGNTDLHHQGAVLHFPRHLHVAAQVLG